MSEDNRYTTLAPAATVETTAAALRERGFEVFSVASSAEAKAKVLELLPEGVEVLTAQSLTLRTLGLLETIDDSGRYQSVRAQLKDLDRTRDAKLFRQLRSSPEWIVGSVHAITYAGQVAVASYGGAQLAPYAYGAGHVIWVVGTHKLVPDLAAALTRIEAYSLPLESARLQAAMGHESHINKLLVFNADQPGRTSIILVGEALGF